MLFFHRLRQFGSPIFKPGSLDGVKSSVLTSAAPEVHVAMFSERNNIYIVLTVKKTQVMMVYSRLRPFNEV